MDIYVFLGNVTDIADLRAQVARYEALGVTGVMASDHLFWPMGPERVRALRPYDPFVALSALGGLSDKLALGVLVANLGWVHPALVIRHFVQMAALFGGNRILAGIGAGWSAEEFDALGLTMPSHKMRIDRLEEAARLARMLFDDGMATMEGSHVVVRGLPISPVPAVSPRLLLGGGSDRALEIAGKYADYLDLNGSPRRMKIGAAQGPERDGVRRATTTIADLEESIVRVRQTAVAAGRGADAVKFSILVDTVVECAASEVEAKEAEVLSWRGMEPISLARCPYILVGDMTQLSDLLQERGERLGLSAVVLRDGPHFERLCREMSRRCGSAR
ncbi:MAG: LLM class flavin-dependent oxidoreductase [Actinomycetota bacterium]